MKGYGNVSYRYFKMLKKTGQFFLGGGGGAGFLFYEEVRSLTSV